MGSQTINITEVFKSTEELSQHLSITELQADGLKLMVLGLQSMLPFTKACHNAGIGPREASNIIRGNPELLNYVKARQRQSYNLLLNAAGDAAKAKDGKALISAVGDIRQYSPTITLWESYCTRADVTPGKVLDAIQLFGKQDMQEVATALGMEHKELLCYISERPGLSVTVAGIGKNK